MSYIYKEGTSIYDVIETINDLMVNGVKTWSIVYSSNDTYEGASRLSHVIWKSTGGDTDIIYLHVWAINAKTMVIDSMVGYDNLLMNWEQPRKYNATKQCMA